MKYDDIEMPGGGVLRIPRKLGPRWWQRRLRRQVRRSRSDFLLELEAAMAKNVTDFEVPKEIT